jgi:uncharacterized protein YecT (DUF1311 family)
MFSFRPSVRELKLLRGTSIMVLLLAMTAIILPGSGASNSQDNSPLSKLPDPNAAGPAMKYDGAIFQNPIPADQLAFLKGFVGEPSANAVRDKRFRKLMHSIIPDCMFHYGWDMPLSDAVEKVLEGSAIPVRIRNGRYFIVSGRSGPYLGGRGFLWIDLRDGIALGAFYFHPTNGEPTPTVTVFSRQVKEESLKMSQVPPEFAQDFSECSREFRVPPITTRYFITGLNKRILLEHDEDYCTSPNGAGAPAAADCQQMNADAADIDLNAAYYLDQVHYATNATAWMIVGDEQTAWTKVRDNTCKAGLEPLRCRIRMTHERTHIILNRHPLAHSSRR